MFERFAVCVVLTFTVAVPCEAASHEQDVVGFELDSDGGIIVPVFVDGQGPFRFLLDTGSTASLVTQSFAARIGAVAVAKAELSSAAGRAMRLIVQVLRVSVGSAASDCLLSSVLPDDAVGLRAPKLDGILGQDFLSPHNYILDYRRRTLSWVVRADDEKGTHLALVRRGTQLVVELPQEKGRIVRLVPDTGSNGLVLFARHGKAAVDVDAVPGIVNLESVVGTLQVRTVSVRELRLGNLTLRNQLGVAVERGDEAFEDGDGLLPLHFFGKVTFNAAGYVVLQR
jgi:Aspartyl protease